MFYIGLRAVDKTIVAAYSNGNQPQLTLIAYSF